MKGLVMENEGLQDKKPFMDELERKRYLALQVLVLKIRDLIEGYLTEHYPEGN